MRRGGGRAEDYSWTSSASSIHSRQQGSAWAAAANREAGSSQIVSAASKQITHGAATPPMKCRRVDRRQGRR